MKLLLTAIREWREYVLYCKIKARYWHMVAPVMPMELGYYPEKHVLWATYNYARNNGMPMEWVAPLTGFIMSRTNRGNELLSDLFFRLNWEKNQ